MSTKADYSRFFDRFIPTSGVDATANWEVRRNSYLNVDSDDYDDFYLDDNENWFEERFAAKVPYSIAGAPRGAQQFELISRWHYRPDPTYVRTFTSRKPFGNIGGSIQVPESVAFVDAVLELERDIFDDPPYRHEDEADEHRRRNASAAEIAAARDGNRPWWQGEDDDPAVIDARVRTRMGNPSQLIETLIRLKERAIRKIPLPANRRPGSAADLEDAGIDSAAFFDLRMNDYDEFLRQELAITISRINFNANQGSNETTEILYNLDPEISGQDGPRGFIGERVSSALQDRWRVVNELMSNGNLEGSSEELDRIERDEEIERLKENNPLLAKETEYFEILLIIQQKFVELNEIRRVLIETQTLVDPVGDFPSEEFLSETKESLEARGIEWTDPLTPPFLAQRELNRYQAILGRPRRRADGRPSGISNLSDSIRSLRSQIDLSIFEGQVLDPSGHSSPIGDLIIGQMEAARVDEQIEAFQQWKDTARERLKEYKNRLNALRAEEAARVKSEMDAAAVGELLRQTRFIVIDSKNRSIEFELPIQENDKSIQVQVIKTYLGLNPSDGDIFDGQMKNRLMEWQDENANDLYDFALRAMMYDGPRSAAPSMREELAEDYGRVTALSFNKMVEGGALSNALEQVYDYNIRNIDGIVTELTPPDVPMNALAKRVIGDGKNPPWSDSKYHYYIYNTDATREQINSDNPDSLRAWYAQNAQRALREGVLQLCDHHARQKTWKVYGNRQEHKVFNSLLRYQNKVQENMEEDQVFTMTVTSQRLSENLGYREDDETPKVDALFGQSLYAGAEPRFANIQQFHGPTSRPDSTWKLEIRVRRDMFDLLPTIDSRAFTIGETIAKAREAAAAVRAAVAAIPDIGADLNQRKEQVADEILSRASSVNSGMAWAKKNKKEALEQGAAAAWGAAKKFSRDAEAAKQFGSGVGPLALSKKQAESFLAQAEANRIDLNTYPRTLLFPLNKINLMIEDVAQMFETFYEEVQNFRRKGGRIRPYIDMREEAKHLRAIIPSLTSFLAANGFVKRDYIRRKDDLEINFEEVPMVRSVPVPPISFGPNAGQPQPPMKIDDIAGGVVMSMNYIYENKTPKPMLQGAIALSQKYPFNVPRTMHYFMNLYSLHEIATDGASCLIGGNPLDPSVNVLDTMRKYSTPALIILPKDPKPMFDIETKIDIAGPIKRFEENLKENLQIDGNGPLPQRWREGIIRAERNKTYAIIDPIPTSELCTLEALFDEFLDKFDFKALFCDYASCIPDLPWPPSFNWDLNFSIPEIPKIPSFDPIAIIIPRIELAIEDLILSFLCGLIRGILGVLRLPDCQDLLEYGKAAWEDLWPDEKRGQKLKIMQDAASVIEDMDMPPDAFVNLADLFDDLSMALTPAELCSLLDGTAEIETIEIVLELIRTRYVEISPYLANEADVANFFMLLGRFVDPDLCNRVSNTSNIILGDVFCPDPNTNSSIRARLESQRATSEEITRALADAAERREAFKDLFNKDPMSDMLPAFGSPGMPGPYDNPMAKQMAETTIKSVLENIELMTKSDLSTLATALTDTAYSQLKEGDPGFDPLGYAEYTFVKQAVESYELGQEQIGGLQLAITAFENLYGDGVEVFANLQRGAVYSVGDYSVQRGNKHALRYRYFVRRGDVNTGVPIPGGGVGTGGIYKERVLDVILEDVARRQAAQDDRTGEGGIPQPSGLKIRQSGEKYVQALTEEDEDGNDKIVFFNLQDSQDVKTVTDILTFPLRNISPNAEVAPWLQGVINEDTTGLFGLDSVSKEARAAFDFSSENLMYNPAPQVRRPNEDRCFQVKIPANKERSKFITYQEIPFNNVEVRSCFNLHRPARLRIEGGSIEGWKGKTITQRLPDEIKALRLSARDISEDSTRLFGPGAFAEMLIESWSSLKSEFPRVDIKDEVSSYGSRAWKKLSGFTNPTDTRFASESAHEMMVEKFINKLNRNIGRSRFFELDQLLELLERMLSEFIETEDADGNICYVENEPFIDFEKIRKELVDKYTQSLSRSEYSPENRDFSKPGPLEDSMGTQMCYLYIKTYVIEFMVRGVFLFSIYGPRSIFQDAMVKEYFTDFLISSVNADLSIDSESRDVFIEEMKKAGNNTDLEEAVRTLVSSFNADEDFMNSIERVFQPEFSSFKESYFYELLASEKQVAPYMHIRKHNRSNAAGTRRGFVPLHKSLGGPLGGESVEDLENLNQGMFYFETYYRFSDDIVQRYITPQNSLFDRLIRPPGLFAGAVNDPNTPGNISNRYQFSGVFSAYELDELLKLMYRFYTIDRISDLNVEAGGENLIGVTSEEVDSFLREVSTSNFKSGMRLIFLPGKGLPSSSARYDEEIGTPIVEIVNSTNGLSETDLFTSIGPFAFRNNFGDPLEDFRLPEDVPTQPELAAARGQTFIGNARERRAARERYQELLAQFNRALRVAENYTNKFPEEVAITTKTRSYIADTSFAYGYQRAPRVTRFDADDIDAQIDAIMQSSEYAYGFSHIVTTDETEDIGIDSDGNPVAAERLGEIHYSAGKPRNIMFPTPIITKETDICFADLFDIEAGNEGDGVEVGLALRQGAKTSLRTQFFGQKFINEGVIGDDVSTEMKYLFDYIFPLDRYQSLYAIQNQILMDGSEQVNALMDPTRGVIKSLATTLRSADSFRTNKDIPSNTKIRSILISDTTSTGPGPKASFALGDLAPQIAKMAAMTIPTLIRGQAAYLDPAYKELKKQFDTDVCKMKAGMTYKVIRPGLTYSPPWSGDGPVLSNGFDSSGGYSPLNVQGVLDMNVVLSALSNPFMLTPGNLSHNVAELLRIVEHLSNAVTGGERRYGKFLSPVGMLAMAMPELEGERYRTRKREAKCRRGEKTAPDFKICEDEPQEEEE